MKIIMVVIVIKYRYFYKIGKVLLWKQYILIKYLLIYRCIIIDH